jgi:hypothetical protein
VRAAIIKRHHPATLAPIEHDWSFQNPSLHRLRADFSSVSGYSPVIAGEIGLIQSDPICLIAYQTLAFQQVFISVFGPVQRSRKEGSSAFQYRICITPHLSGSE